MRSLITAALLVINVATVADACMRVTPVTPGMPATECKSCSPVPIAPFIGTNIPFDPPAGPPDNTGACTTVKFVCKGKGAEIDFGIGPIEDGGDYDPDKTVDQVTVTATCQSGSKWIVKLGGTDYDVKKDFSCSLNPAKGLSACQECAEVPRVPGVPLPGTGTFMRDPFMTNACSTATLVCQGPNAVLDIGSTEINDGPGGGDPDGVKNGDIRIPVTCGNDKTWTYTVQPYPPFAVTKLECYLTP